ncbi:synaptic vesicle glycoprotein 2 [Holotrichia oblita]|uniref:Synaptic vesicle glycoprotein 2 n=1 Tax=Holotrichia oblita TaxID=644536 RepID=A0ACB9SSE0_HOLOL|nr:synaptic vesicle glycoprotein 2 [Holotrichia oblita]
MKGKFDINGKDEDRQTEIENATFEEAISATGFGKFNLVLVALSVPCGWASMMDTTTMSYVVPAAHCDLDLNLQQRGMLNAITYLGMITSALLWGFLADTLGRKKILIAGYLIDAVCVIIAGLSQSYEMLVTAKFFTGLIMNGPFAALTTTISEFHSAKHRTRTMLALGVMYGFGQLIKSLVDETKLNLGGKHGGAVTANRTKTQALKEGWQQVAPMFFPPHLWKIILASAIQCGLMWGTNTIRLWLPQIFTAMNDYQLLHPGETASFCTMLSIISPDDNVTTIEECFVSEVSDSVYINAIIVSGTSIIVLGIISGAINKLGKKPTLLTLTIISAVASICFYFAPNSTTVVALSTINVTFLAIALNLELTIVVDMFPTTLRAIAVSITLMIGRSGAMVGNVVFPYLLAAGCLPPFVMVGSILLLSGGLTLLLPKTDMKALE